MEAMNTVYNIHRATLRIKAERGNLSASHFITSTMKFPLHD